MILSTRDTSTRGQKSIFLFPLGAAKLAVFEEENINEDTEMASKRMLKRSVTCLIVSASSL